MMMCLFLGLVAGQVPEVWNLAGNGRVRPRITAAGSACRHSRTSSVRKRGGHDFATIQARSFMFWLIMAMAKIVPASAARPYFFHSLFTVSIEEWRIWIFCHSLPRYRLRCRIFLAARMMSDAGALPQETYYLIFDSHWAP